VLVGFRRHGAWLVCRCPPVVRCHALPPVVAVGLRSRHGPTWCRWRGRVDATSGTAQPVRPHPDASGRTITDSCASPAFRIVGRSARRRGSIPAVGPTASQCRDLHPGPEGRFGVSANGSSERFAGQSRSIDSGGAKRGASRAGRSAARVLLAAGRAVGADDEASGSSPEHCPACGPGRPGTKRPRT
jgi:hypothetical protein